MDERGKGQGGIHGGQGGGLLREIYIYIYIYAICYVQLSLVSILFIVIWLWMMISIIVIVYFSILKKAIENYIQFLFRQSEYILLLFLHYHIAIRVRFNLRCGLN